MALVGPGLAIGPLASRSRMTGISRATGMLAATISVSYGRFQIAVVNSIPRAVPCGGRLTGKVTREPTEMLVRSCTSAT